MKCALYEMLARSFPANRLNILAKCFPTALSFLSLLVLIGSFGGVTRIFATVPSSVNFGNVAVGSTSKKTVTITNNHSVAWTLTSLTVTGTWYKVSGLSLPITIKPGLSVSFTISFTPTATGTFTGSVTLSTSQTSLGTISLTGTGVTLLLTLSPTSLNFGNVAVGRSSTLSVKVANAGTAAVTISGASLSGTDFKLGGLTLPLTVGAGQSTSFSATFTPAATGAFSGKVSLTSNATDSPSTERLSGTGVTLLLTLSPTSLSFGNVMVGHSSTLSVKVANAGTAAVTISGASLSGTDFKLGGLTLPLTVGAGQSTSFSVTFTPAATGAFSGTVSLKSNATNSPGTARLSGTGITPLLTLIPTSLKFGNILVGETAVLPVIITNIGTTAATISSASVSTTGFKLADLTLPLTLNPGQSTSFSVIFAPATAGTFSGTASLASNAADSPSTEYFSGAGDLTHSVTLTWAASTSTGVTGYNVYRGTLSGGPYTKLNASLVAGTSYTDSTVGAGQTYYYVTTAATSTAQSGYSNQAVVKVPWP